MASARYSPGLNDDGVNISNVFTSAGNDSYYTTETPAEVVTHVYSGAAGLAEFNDWYKDVHGYLAATVCVFGIIANILNIVVLTRKNMISATNCILTGLAVSDGLTMLAYFPFALRFYCIYGTEPTPERNSSGAIRFMLFYACFSVVVHTVSIWLTVVLAVFRYIFIKYPRHAQTMCSLRRAKIATFVTYVVTLIVCLPNFVTYKITTVDNGSIYYVQVRMDSQLDTDVYKMNFWVQAVVVKLVPCIGLTILSVLLVRCMHKAEARRKHLRGKKDDDTNRDRKTNRTTRMLLIVVILFVLTELPQGILSLLSGILPSFFDQIYSPMGDMLDILALVNNGINFILYCTMSKQFRETFIQVFFKNLRNETRKFSLVPTNGNTKLTDL